MRYILLFLFLCSCQTGPKTIEYHEDFSVIVKDYFSNKLKYYGTDKPSYNIKMVYGKLKRPKIGICNYGNRTITIDYDYYNYQSQEESRYNLIYHELGHCDLNFDHQDDREGIMNRANNFYFNNKAVQNFFERGW